MIAWREMRMIIIFLLMMGAVLAVMASKRFDVSVGDIQAVIPDTSLFADNQEEATDEEEQSSEVAGVSIVAPMPKVNPVLELPENLQSPFAPQEEVDEEAPVEEDRGTFFSPVSFSL